MPAAEQDQTEQELPKSIFQPRHVRMALNADSLQRDENGYERFPVNSEAGRCSWPAEAMFDK